MKSGLSLEGITVPTLGEILRPTKGSDSYARIANRANEWFRGEAQRNGQIPITRMSSEQVRRIFEDQTERPNTVYLRALSAAQGVDLGDLYEAGGYRLPESDPIRGIDRHLRASRPDLPPDAIAAIDAFIKRVLEEHPQEEPPQ